MDKKIPKIICGLFICRDIRRGMDEPYDSGKSKNCKSMRATVKPIVELDDSHMQNLRFF
jgi:hypothetical protein